VDKLPILKSLDSVKIFYEVIGEGDISLVLIGGLGAPTGRVCWRNQLKYAVKYKLVLIDLAGHGRSGKNREKYTMELYGQDIKTVVESLDLDKIIILGWSLGGAAVLESELLLSDRIIGIIPIDSLFPNSMYTKMDEETIKGVIRPYEDDFVKAYDELIDSFISDKFDSKEIEFLHSQTPKLDARSMISALAELARWNMFDILPKVKSPIKSIIAERTIQYYPKEEYEKYFDAVYVKGVGHLLSWEDPEAFNEVLSQLIEEFLTTYSF